MSHNEFTKEISLDKFHKQSLEDSIRNIIRKIIAEKYGTDNPMSIFPQCNEAFKLLEEVGVKIIKKKGIEIFTQENMGEVKEILEGKRQYSAVDDEVHFYDNGITVVLKKKLIDMQMIQEDYSFSTNKNKNGEDEFCVKKTSYYHPNEGYENSVLKEIEEKVFNKAGIQIKTSEEQRYANNSYIKCEITRKIKNIEDLYKLHFEELFCKGELDPKFNIDSTSEKLYESTIDLPDNCDPSIIPNLKTLKPIVEKKSKEHQDNSYSEIANVRISDDCKRYPFFRKALEKMGLIPEDSKLLV